MREDANGAVRKFQYLFLLAMASFYRQRPFSWAVFAATGFHLNSMYGAYALTHLPAVFVGFQARRERRPSANTDPIRALPRAAIREMSSWARTATPIESVFLIPPAWQSFRAISQRSVFTTWKDGSAILWYRPFLQEWAARLQALGFDIRRHKAHAGETPPELIERYEGLNDADVARIKARYALDYWVVPATHASAFPVVFEGLGYKILCLSDGTMCPPGPQ